MRIMETETPAQLPAPARREQGQRGAVASRRGPGLVLLVVLLLVIGAFVWWLIDRQMREREAGRADALSAQVAQLARANEQLRHDVDSLRSRYADSETMNRGIREEVLAFNERSRTLEDAVANLADQRVNNRDAMALNEAEFILQLAGERLALFRDASGAMAAYRLADSALAAAEDPLFASVRQTINAEMQALEAAQPMQTQATLNALASVRGSLSELPAKAAPANALAPVAGERSRLREILAQFVRISSDETSPALAARNDALTRTLAAVDLRTAEAMLFARDQEGFVGAVDRARKGIQSAFDGDNEAVRKAVATLDKLAATPLAPALPELGTALGELRNLRTTRALSRPPAPPIGDGVSP
ncbi:MAG TPA: uroporphyrinogen-III C-methyltransferase [Dokdonella sp.]|nr:uroporphyrinogen-III C-methyltransferase [Dokdonella sp.]